MYVYIPLNKAWVEQNGQQPLVVSFHQDKLLSRCFLATFDAPASSGIPNVNVLATFYKNAFEGDKDIASAYLGIHDCNVRDAIRDYLDDVSWERQNSHKKPK
eukprot:c5915_g1_i1.p2 GENE.c5915_g1_i1~~c5915_g1_i1.p2  ORF type:complete len:102 (+),score=18.71 c5915_g1_i1:569-874(+)